MTKIYKLQNQITHYDWGSPELIPDLLGLSGADKDPKKPCAEMWMGTNPSAPSLVSDSGASLKEISGELPFLLKLIAVEKPLSIQVHPDKEQAQAGFKRENEEGIEIDSPLRNYKDQNAKNELICAITPFTLIAGFMEPEKIYASLGGDTLREQWDLVRKLESLYPQDVGIYSPLSLNVITLQPGQGLFIPAGTPHAYISGFGAELMTNSDNVIRGGLTSKHVDIDELKRIAKPVPYIPQIITPCGESQTCYPLAGENFSLYRINGGGKSVPFPQSEHSICIVTEGELKTENQIFKKGESFYIPSCGKDALLLEGNFSLFAACVTDTK
jgi:mannose-6-phosphate isomerase